MLLPFGGKDPRDEGAVFVAPNATVLGDVVLGPGSSVWYGAVLRGDDGTLTLGENTNVQDNAVLHCDPGGAVTLGKNCIIGAGALVPEGKIIPDDSLVVGVPGKIIKQVSPEQAAANLANAAHYVGEGRRHAAALRKEEKGENK